MTSRNAVRRSVPKAELPDFTPVPRKNPRHDGWTPERQRAFIEALADTGCVQIACRMVNMTTVGAYYLRRQPGAESFRAAWEAAQGLGLQVVKDEAFDRAMNGQLIPVFVAGKLMGFRRKKNDRLLMFILRNYGFGPGGTRTTVNYVSTRAGAAASSSSLSRSDGEGDRVQRGGGAIAEASTTTVRTMMSGGNAQTQLAADTEAANLVNAFAGIDLDPEAQAEIYRTLESCAERRRALESDPENDPDRFFIGERETTGYLGELEIGSEGDWVEYRPEGEHLWEGLGEGGNAAEIDEVLRGMEERKRLPAPLDPPLDSEGSAGSDCSQQSEIEPGARSARHWTAEAAVEGQTYGEGPERAPAEAGAQPISRRPQSPAPAESKIAAGNAGDRPRKRSPEPVPSTIEGRSRRAYKKPVLSNVEGRTPKPPFTPPEPALAESKIAAGNAWEARKAEAVAEVAAERRESAAAEAERRKAKAR